MLRVFTFFPRILTAITECDSKPNIATGQTLTLISKFTTKMENVGVLMTCPMSKYLEEELEKRFNPLKPWTQSSASEFLSKNSESVRAVVGNTKLGADAQLINSLPKLEIVSSYSVGLEKIDMGKCRSKRIRVTNTPDVLMDDVADVAIRLALAVLRRICTCDGFVRNNNWKENEKRLATKFSGKSVGIVGLGMIGTTIANRVEALCLWDPSIQPRTLIQCGLKHLLPPTNTAMLRVFTFFPRIPTAITECDSKPNIATGQTLISKFTTKMENVGVLMTCPMSKYLEEELEKRFNLLKPWTQSSASEFLSKNSESVRAVVGNTKLGADAQLINSLPKLEIVSSYSVGLEKIDLGKCRSKGIRVTNTPDVLTDDVADVAIGLALAVLRRICTCDGFVRNNNWKESEKRLATKFSGKSVGIVGLGRIGTAIAKRAEAFGCPVNYFSRAEKASLNYKFYSDITEMAENSRILIVACALTEETHHIINREVLDALGPEGIFINIGRGQHVDEPELVSALLEGRLGGAGLDVFEDEPNVPDELLKLENVVLLPHVGSDTIETSKAMADLVVQNLEAHFSNKPLLTPII